VTNPLPPASAIVGISLLGDQWIPTNSAAPVQMTARLITSNTPFEYAGDRGSDLVDRAADVALSISTAASRRRSAPRRSPRNGDKTGINPIRVLPGLLGQLVGQFRITAAPVDTIFASADG
jgi:hypothetical protein